MNSPALPSVEEIRQNVHRLSFPDSRELFLVGTAHVSSASVELVEEVILEKRPDTVCIELDEDRYRTLTGKVSYDDLDIIQIIRKKQLFFFIGQLILSSYQKKISAKTGSKPGMEFRRAIELTEETGARLVLADRNIGTTLKRAYRLTPLWHKIRFMASLFTADDDDLKDMDIEKLKTRDAIENLVRGFEKELPVTKHVLIDERDEFLSSEIRNNLGQVTVAVVGAGHVPGILKQMQGSVSAERKREINIIPEPSLAGRLLPWLIPAAVAGIIIWGFFNGRREIAGDVIIYWILVTGSLSALGCLLSLAHPLTTLSGFIAAPITTLHPLLGVGFITALVQTLTVKPRIRDFEELRNGSLPVRKWWVNRITRILLVFLLSSIGASIGMFAALPALTRLFSN
jgi:pheromone shutdown-related protein TraB